MRNLSEISEPGVRAGELTSWAKTLLKHADRYNLDRVIEHERVPDRVRRIIAKAAVAGDTLGSEPDIDRRVVSGAFLDSLRSGTGIFDTLLAGGMVRAPLDTPSVMTSTSLLLGHEIGEGRAKPLTSVNLGAASLLKRKAASMVVVSDTLANSASGAAEAMIARALRSAVVAATDVAFLSGLMSGVTATASAGPSAAQIMTDLNTALGKLSLTSDSRVYLIVPPAHARGLALKLDTAGTRAFQNVGLQGGELVNGLRVLVSDSLPAGASPLAPVVLVVDASQIAGDTGELELAIARHASIEMADDPTNASAAGSPSAPVDAEMVSMFQTNSRALRCERFFGYIKLTATAVAAISATAW